MGRGQVSPCRYERLGRTADSTTVTTVTADAAANTKGAYATIGTTTFAYSGFYFHSRAGSAGNLRFRYDIAINTGGSDVIIVEDFFQENQLGVAHTIWFPVSVPSGAAIKARCQSTTGASPLGVFTTGYMAGPNGPPSYSRVIACTDFTNSDATNGNTLNGTTQTAYAVVEGSTLLRVAGLYVSPSGRGDATRTGVNLCFDISRGAGGSEVVMFSGQMSNNGATNAEAVAGTMPAFPFWYDLPAGTALSVRSVASAACTDTFGVCLYGLVP